jgi:hypothetical protein
VSWILGWVMKNKKLWCTGLGRIFIRNKALTFWVFVLLNHGMIPINGQEW